MDDKKTGPLAIQLMRDEWEKRVNAELAKAGIKERVDLRSYKKMAEAGDAPAGLRAQPKLGPKNNARGKKRVAENGHDDTFLGAQRDAIRARNDELWSHWLQLRALERELLREKESARIAAERERERKREVAERQGRDLQRRPGPDAGRRSVEEAYNKKQRHWADPNSPIAARPERKTVDRSPYGNEFYEQLRRKIAEDLKQKAAEKPIPMKARKRARDDDTR